MRLYHKENRKTTKYVVLMKFLSDFFYVTRTARKKKHTILSAIAFLCIDHIFLPGNAILL